MINKKNLNGLNKRMMANTSRGSGNGGSNFSVMDWKKSGNDELKFFKPVVGKNTIDIVPYEVKSKNHPLVKSGEMDIGDMDYMFEVWQHTNVGPSKKSVLCLNRMYNKPCPICEAANTFRKSGKEEEAKALYAKQRAFYNVVDVKEPDAVKVFEVSYKLFEKELLDEAKDNDEGFASFADPTENGCSVKFRAEEKNGGSFTFKEFKSFGFIDRDYDLDDKVLEQAVSFDECLKVPSYDEVLSVFNGEDDDDEEEDEVTSAKKSFENYEDEDRPVKKNRQDEDEPVRPSKNRHVEEDDDETPHKNCKKDCDECPFGYKFGEDNDNYEECDECKLWAKCSDAQE